ncbi:hypothetical protein J6590_031050 [Homalodisca vitripennis]|nr:hypothetical protein J6590_031050 [Homalodisca vitripennis]
MFLELVKLTNKVVVVIPDLGVPQTLEEEAFVKEMKVTSKHSRTISSKFLQRLKGKDNANFKRIAANQLN